MHELIERRKHKMGPHYNYRSAAELKAKYEWAGLPSELHGTSVFLRVGDRVFHTYSTYGRGTEPKGRAASLGPRADQRRHQPGHVFS